MGGFTYQVDSSQAEREMQVGARGRESMLLKGKRGAKPSPKPPVATWLPLARQDGQQDLHQGKQQLSHQRLRSVGARDQPRED